jgi:hypothetical protein
MSEGALIVGKRLGVNVLTTGRVKLSLVVPHLRDCKSKDTSRGNPEGEATLVVEYSLYTTDYFAYFSSLYESEGQGLSRGVLPTPLTKFLSSNSPKPYVGFNRSRAIFGGASFSSKSDNPLFNQITFDASGSSSSTAGGLSLQGSRDFNSKALGHAEWVAGYSYSNIPSASTTLKRGRSVVQFIGATQPLLPLNLVVRYGASVEAGNRQTDIAAGLVPHGILTSTGYGSFKLFAGNSIRKGANDFSASYALEVGGTGSDRQVDYLKHIVDVGYSRGFLPRPHMPITLDAHFTLGDLDTRGVIPLGVRFFGGNAEQNFLVGDNWVIRSDPFIRCFAQNQFTPQGPAAPLGGDRFYSLNVTFSPTVWGRPLVPQEVIDSPDFLPNVNGAFKTVSDAALASYLADAPAVTDFANSLLKLDDSSPGHTSPIKAIKDQLSSFEQRFAGNQDALGIIANVRTVLDDTQARLADLRTEVNKRGQVINKLERVAKDFTSCTDFGDPIPGASSSLHVSAAALQDLMGLLDAQGIPPSDEHRQKIQAQSDVLNSIYRKAPCEFALLAFSTDVSCSCQGDVDGQTRNALISALAGAQQKAADSIGPARQLFDRLTNELNLVAVSPLCVFDAAGIRSTLSGSRASSTRYGVGGGIRISIVSVDVDLGYSFNVRRLAGEGRGAFVFSLKINDLLR